MKKDQEEAKAGQVVELFALYPKSMGPKSSSSWVIKWRCLMPAM
jgi:hypothetical protein